MFQNIMQKNSELIKKLKEKASWIRRETIKIHGLDPGTRLASSLSDVEIFVALYYGKVLNFNPENPGWQERDRFIVSKPHGAVSMYPLLADLGFFDKSELEKACQKGSFLGSIPDRKVPGIETINGALGHGLGVACGMALALRRQNSFSTVFVLSGDGELYEGAVWEAVMFAAEHHLDNLILIIDNNKISMLDYCKNIIDLTPLEEKFKSFKWKVRKANGHNVEELIRALSDLKKEKGGRPKLLIADTIKGKGVPQLENNPLCHIRSLKREEINEILKNYGN